MCAVAGAQSPAAAHAYPEGDALKQQAVAYLSSGPDDAKLGSAAHALVAYHDPATVHAILGRALDDSLSTSTRAMLLTQAPLVLGMGDVIFLGGQALDTTVRRRITALNRYADSASRLGLGRAHAAHLRAFYDSAFDHLHPTKIQGLAITHFSAHLIGMLDLRDAAVLDPMLDTAMGPVLGNILRALSLAATHDFTRGLAVAREHDKQREAALAAIADARSWWRTYLRDHPDGDWRPAAIAGLRAQGYEVDADLRSALSRREMLRALDTGDNVVRFGTLRLLNDLYDVHVDLEPLFAPEKYAGFLLPQSPSRDEQEAKVRAYWLERLEQ